LGAFLVCEAVAYGIVLTSFTFFVKPWSAEFGVSNGTVMLCILAASLMCAPIGFVLGIAIDRFSLRFLIAGGAACYAISLILLSQSVAFWQVFGIYCLLVPVTMILLGPAVGQVLATRWFPHRRGAAIGMVLFGTSLGGVLLPPVVALMFESLGWRDTFLFLGLGIVCAVPAIPLLIRNQPRQVQYRDHMIGVPLAVNDRHWSAADILKDREFWMLLVSIIPLSGIFTALQIHAAPIADERDFSPAHASLLVSSVVAAAIVSKPFTGALVDWMPYRTILATLALLSIVGIVALSFSSGPIDTVAAFALLGFATGGAISVLGAALAYRYGAAMLGRAMGLAMLVLPLAMVAAPMLAFIRAATGSYQTSLLYLGVLLVPALIGVAALGARPRSSTNAASSPGVPELLIPGSILNRERTGLK
jgi:MFS family permease